MQEERELKGFSDLGEFSINCQKCGAPLVYIQLVKKSPKQNTITVECPHCPGESEETLVEGEFYLGPTEFTNVLDMDTESINGKTRFKSRITTTKGTQIYEG